MEMFTCRVGTGYIGCQCIDLHNLMTFQAEVMLFFNGELSCGIVYAKSTESEEA